MIFKKLIDLLKEKYSEVFFIGDAKTLPPPLDKDEELKYILKCKSGDINAVFKKDGCRR